MDHRYKRHCHAEFILRFGRLSSASLPDGRRVYKLRSRNKFGITSGNVLTSLLLGVFGIMFLGAVIGTNFDTIQTRVNTKADSSSPCFYSAETVILHEDETPLTSDENGKQEWGVSNSIQLKLNPDKIAGQFGIFDDNNNQINEYFETDAVYKYINDNLTFGRSDDLNAVHENEPISVTLLGLNQSKWKITSMFCESLNPNFSACPSDLSTQTVGTMINNFIPKCGTDIRYGWMVTERDPNEISPTQAPTNEPDPTISQTPSIAPTNPVTNTPTGIPTVTTSPTNSPQEPLCKQKDDPCKDFYSEKCKNEDGKDGVKECYKVGKCTERGDGTKCGWDPDKSSCGNCIPKGGTDQNPPPDPNDPPNCTSIVGNGSKRVLFIPYRFSSASQFAKYTSLAIDNIRSTNLGNLYNNFSFSAYNNLTGSYGCRDDVDINGNGKQFGCTDYSAIHKAMSECNASAALVIANVPDLGAYSSTGSGTATVKIGSITFSAHELGHAIASLDDEYSYNITTSTISPNANCSSENSCSKWRKTIQEIGCHPVCGFTNWYRSSIKSVMNKDGNKNNLWNWPSLLSWENALRSAQASFFNQYESEERMYRTSLYLNLRQNQRGELAVLDLQIKQSYPIDLDQNLTEDHFTVNMIDVDGKLLYSGQFRSYETRVSEPVGRQDVMREIIPLSLPYYEHLYSVEIFDADGQKKLDIDLDEYDIPSPTPPANLCGNGVCDAGIGENRTSCEADCAQQNEHRDEYKIRASDINDDGYVNTLDCSVCLFEYKKVSSTTTCDIITDEKVDALDYTACINNLGVQVSQPTEAPFETQAPTQSPQATTRPTTSLTPIPTNGSGNVVL